MSMVHIKHCQMVALRTQGIITPVLAPMQPFSAIKEP